MKAPSKEEVSNGKITFEATNSKGQIVDLTVIPIDKPEGKIQAVSYERKSIPEDESPTRYFTP